MSDVINLEIDGKKCTCAPGEYLYDVAKRNGVFIPVLCRHEAFEDHRACCRICIVEVEINGRTKIVTSCVYPVERDCIVRTNTERIMEERKVIYALLKNRAPESNIPEPDEGFKRLTSLDSGKCILCGLCVQACDSLGSGAISTVNRGTDKEVNTPYGNPAVSCIGCLSCANVCPTEAINFEETQDTRKIWNKEFKLVKCEKCGATIGTEEQVKAACKDNFIERPELCDKCKKELIAEEARKIYSNA